jgi:hypothetical protein
MGPMRRCVRMAEALRRRHYAFWTGGVVSATERLPMSVGYSAPTWARGQRSEVLTRWQDDGG